MKAGTGEKGEYRNILLLCRNGIRKAKAHLQLNLGKDGKGNMKDFNRAISNKRQISENEGLTLNRVGEKGHGKG